MRCPALSLFLLTSLGCGCGPATGGNALSLPFAVQGSTDVGADGSLRFTSASGWDLVLTEAKLLLGPVYLSAVPDLPAALRPEQATLQWLGQIGVDALAPRPQTSDRWADGLAGQAVSLFAGLQPAGAGAEGTAAVLGAIAGSVGRVAGTASRAGVSIRFAGPLAPDLASATAALPSEALSQVRGAAVRLPLSVADTANQQLRLRLDPRPWFDGADFGLLPAGADANAPRTWRSNTAFGRALWQGVQARVGAYQVVLTPRP